MLRTLTLAAALFSLCSTAFAGNYLADCRYGHALPTKSVARMAMPSDLGIEGHLLYGTVWFIGRQQIVAILHEHAAVLENWTEITLSTGNVVGSIPTTQTTTLARISQVVKIDGDEDLYIIETAETFDDIEVPRVRFGAPLDNEAVFSLTYDNGVFTLVTGRHVLPRQSNDPYQQSEPPPPFLMFELADPAEEDRFVVDFGTSGSPIFDCNGQVVASIAKVVSQERMMFGKTVRLSTPWGMPNVFGTPTGMIVIPE